MLRIFGAALAGGIAVYVWGVAAWLVLPLHNQTLQPLPEGQEIATLLKHSGVPAGAYSFPSPMSPDASLTEQEMKDCWEEFVKQHEAGPVFSVYYHPGGMSPMGPKVMGCGFAIDVLACLLAALLVEPLARSGASFFLRWRTVVGLGLFTSLVSYGALWNWMAFPLRFVADMMLDVVLCWTLAGLVIAAIVKPAPKMTT